MSKFDIALSSQSTLKERFVWLLYLGIVFFLLYGSVNQYALITQTQTSFFMEWEKSIPFIEGFIVPYMSSDILFVVAFLLSQTRISLKILALRSFMSIIISVSIFALFPLKFAFEKPLVDNFLFDMLEMDLPYNQMPSLHVSLAVILWFSMKNNIKSKLIKIVLFIWLILVILSTLLVYQHHFIDIPTGFLVGIILVYLINEKRETYFTKSFTTPRNIKIALYYLVLSIIFMVLSFKLSSIICLYLFLSIFSLSAIYTFGLNDFLISKNPYINVLQKIFFLPYFIGSHLSWIYYKRKIPFISKFNENIYFGRQADTKEYEKLKELGIKKIINLCPELQFNKIDIPQKRYNFLDLTMQSPKNILEVIKEIENSHDKIYIHCKLGMSRTILVISSYMLYKEKSFEDIEKFLKERRPLYVKSKYMKINLDIFKELLL
ncbi:phosphatase PAP2 family protein [Arcobacter sp. LA11]|uniref:phosphatase PAP2 family protein n=1 Tax=Arcobacter sp. LA11 TaxID=1898176 RepID=UPI0009340381|nr:phosphatase PAP2 family protein [Arcobacter sp. LA11]